MADGHSGNSHDASDKKLDKAAFAESDQTAAKGGHGAQGHDPAKIAQHDDTGKDRLFEGREQHDEAEKNSEKGRLAKDMDKHNHPVDEQEADAGNGPSAKRKS